VRSKKAIARTTAPYWESKIYRRRKSQWRGSGWMQPLKTGRQPHQAYNTSIHVGYNPRLAIRIVRTYDFQDHAATIYNDYN